MSDKRESAEVPTEQGGLPNEYAPKTGEVVGQGRPQEGMEEGRLLISGVNTGPDDEEREILTPTEERARLSLLGDERDPIRQDNPESDPDALADRGD